MLINARMLLSMPIALATASAALATANDTPSSPTFERSPQPAQPHFAYDLKSPAETPNGPYFYVNIYGVPLPAERQVHPLDRPSHGAKTHDH
jgi:hypothetical protein